MRVFARSSFPPRTRAEDYHGFDEQVDLESVRKVTKTIALFIAAWCGAEGA